jgi:hypothetical protein
MNVRSIKQPSAFLLLAALPAVPVDSRRLNDGSCRGEPTKQQGPKYQPRDQSDILIHRRLSGL